MNFKDKILGFFGAVGAALRSLCLKIKNFVLSHKKASIITAIAVAVVAIVLVVVFCIIIPKWNYSNKVVTTIDGHDYTQSEIDEIGDWWSEYIKGNNIYNEGDTPLDK